MTDHKLDQWRDWMVAALCGELEPEQRRQLDQAMERDEALRQDWLELCEAQQGLQALAGEQSDAGSGSDAAVTTWMPPGIAAFPSRTTPRWRWLLASAAGFAAAAGICFVLLLAGLRIDRADGGMLVRFDGTATAQPPVTGEAPLTRTELAAYTQLLMDVTDRRFEQLEQRQASTQAEVAQVLFDALVQQQQHQYNDLRSRIELAVYHSAAHPTALPGLTDPPAGNRQPY